MIKYVFALIVFDINRTMITSVIIDGYWDMLKEIHCGGSELWNSLEVAVQHCNGTRDCVGLYDKNCDGRNIYTCGNLSLHNTTKGCTYAKKRQQLSPGMI